MEEKAFTWIELETIQAPYLLQATCELVEMMKNAVEKPEFKKPAWARKPEKQSKLTWKLFKKEVFGAGQEGEEEPMLDDLQGIHSDDDDDDDELVTDHNRAKKNTGRHAASRSYAV